MILRRKIPALEPRNLCGEMIHCHFLVTNFRGKCPLKRSLHPCGRRGRSHSSLTQEKRYDDHKDGWIHHNPGKKVPFMLPVKTMPYGHYQGFSLLEVPREYIHYLASERKFDEETRQARLLAQSFGILYPELLEILPATPASLLSELRDNTETAVELAAKHNISVEFLKSIVLDQLKFVPPQPGNSVLLSDCFWERLGWKADADFALELINADELDARIVFCRKSVEEKVQRCARG